VGKRILTTVVGLPILVFVLLQGGILLTVSLLIVTLIGLHEFYTSVSGSNYQPVPRVGYAGALSVYAVLIVADGTGSLGTILPLVLMAFLIYWVMTHHRHRFEDMMITWFGFTYVTLLLIPLAFFEQLALPHAVWLVFIISWSCDSGAYLIGCGIGRHKLCPTISPRKTIEGAVGGIAGSILGSLIFALLFMPEHLTALMILGFIGAVFSQLGDLAASLIKRTVGIKDFGHLFPGHGGVLDRFDSILFTTPVVYLFMVHWLLR
jgi:phosphatidate cytidylyltransferase